MAENMELESFPLNRAINMSNTDRLETIKSTVCEISLVSIWAVLGCLLRIGISDETNFWPNLLGSFLITFTSTFLTDPESKDLGFFKTGFSTGFCGSLTTFSGWMLFTTKSYLDTESYVMSLISNFAAFFLACQVGNDLKKLLKEMKIAKISFYLNILLYLGLLSFEITALFFIFNGQPGWAKTTMHQLFLAQFGAVARWLLCKLNSKSKLPIGTLLCNTLGVLILSLVDTFAGKTVWIDGLKTGFCSSLTTVSSFMNDILKLQVGRKQSKSCFWLIYTYVSMTVGMGILITQLVVKLG